MDAVGDVLEVFGGWREGRQRKVVSVRGVDAVEDVFEVFSIGCGRGTPENGGISPEWMQSGMF